MDKHELADQYISQVRDEFDPHLGSGPGLLSVALIRACEDLLICRDEFARYKAKIVQERQEDLARALGIPVGVLNSIMSEQSVLEEVFPKPQDRAGAEQPPSRPDPQGTPVTPRHGPAAQAPEGILPSDSPPSPVRCPNCGEWAEWLDKTAVIYCPHCDYEEDR